MAKIRKSFYDWCIDNGKEEWLELWDYEKNGCSPKDIGYATNKKYFFKCSRGLHDSEEKRIDKLTNGHTEFKCKYCNSFEQFCIDNGKEYWLDLWDYELNNCSPKDIPYGTQKKYYFKCPRGLHDSEEKRIADLTSGNTNLKCKYCNSFEQWCIDNEKEDWLALWDYELNNCTPKDVDYGSRNECWFKCPRGLHDSEKKIINDLTNGRKFFKCKYCNSIGQYLIDNYGENALEKYWDYKKNGSLDPFKIQKACSKKVWLKCQENETHGSYFVSCANFTSGGRRCPICRESHGERKIREYLMKNNIEFIPQKTFSNLLGTGNKPLSYDFYIPSKNLLVEFQGEQHYRPVDFNNEGMEQAEKNFEIQQEHDRRKRDYAQQNNIDLLEITYLEEDEIEEILDKIFK